MKYILLFLFALLLNPVFSQNKWTFGAMAAPDVSFTPPLTKQPDYQQIPKMGFELGLNAFRKINKSIYFQTGLILANRRHNTNYYNVLLIKEGKVVDTFNTYHSVNNFDLNIPVCFNFRFRITDKFSVTTTEGAVLGWYLRARRKVKSIYFNYDDNENRKKGVDFIYVSIGLGGVYKINDKVSLMVMPNVLGNLDSRSFYSPAISLDLRTTLLYSF